MSNMDHSNSWDYDGVDDHNILIALEEFIQEVEAVSPFMRDYFATGFYMAKFDEIVCQVCPSSSIVKYEQSQNPEF